MGKVLKFAPKIDVVMPSDIDPEAVIVVQQIREQFSQDEIEDVKAELDELNNNDPSGS